MRGCSGLSQTHRGAQTSGDGANRLILVSQRDSEPKPGWQVRVVRSRAFAWLELCRPSIGFWVNVSALLMPITAAHGSLYWGIPIQYAMMVVLMSYAGGAFNNAADAGIDASTRLMRPIPAGRLSARGAYVFSIALATAGALFGLLIEWRVTVIGLAMFAAVALYSIAWRGSVLGALSFALIGVLLPVSAIQAIDAEFSNAHLLWTLPVGGLTGAAAFMIYKLPDFEIDDVDGSRSLLHWLGIDMAVPMAWAVLAAALALAAASINLSGGNLLWLLGPLLYLILAGLFCIVILMGRVTEIRLRLQRYLVLPLLPLLIICWLGAAASA